ncbi:MAG: hypothetical protein WBP85_18125 [Terracidiphilus sp.]
MELKLRATMYLTDGFKFLSRGTPFQYKVEGLPEKLDALLCNFGNSRHPQWRILLIGGDDASDGWTGQYESEQQALEALSDMASLQ